jgi:hypothetical protein
VHLRDGPGLLPADDDHAERPSSRSIGTPSIRRQRPATANGRA